jgi:hypothetical protein
MHARNAGVNMVFIHALSENTAMLKIARNAGATVHRDGSESEAYLQIPPASLDTRMAEMVEQQFAEVDYQPQEAGQAVLGLSGRRARSAPRRAARAPPVGRVSRHSRPARLQWCIAGVVLSRQSAILGPCPPQPHVLHPRQCPIHTPSACLKKKTSALSAKSGRVHSPRPRLCTEELIETLAEAEDNEVIGADSRVMLERVIRMADMTAGDVMVAAPRMDMIDIDGRPMTSAAFGDHAPRIRAFRCTRGSAKTSSAS